MLYVTFAINHFRKTMPQDKKFEQTYVTIRYYLKRHTVFSIVPEFGRAPTFFFPISITIKSPEINHPGDFMFLLSSSCRVVVVINKKKWSKRVLKGVKGSKIA